MSGNPAWGKEHVERLLEETAPPGEELKGFDDRMSFVGALALAIRLEDDGKLFFEALNAKYPEGVKKHLSEAQLLAKEPIPV